jgi:type II secretory pathway component HofQ
VRISVVLAVLWLASLAASPPAGAAAEVYRAKHRTAEELLPLAETLLAGEGSVAVDSGTNALVLVGEPDALARVVALLESQDRALRNVVLRYESRRVQELEAEGIAVAWSVGGGDVRVGNVDRRGGSGVDVRVGAASTERASELAGTLRVLEGRSGRIATGSLVPYTVGRRWRRETTLVAAESGVEVHPRILGDGRVQLELRPFEASPERGGVIRGASAATTLVVEPGRTVALGGIAREEAGSVRSPVSGAARAAGSEERVLLVTVEVE